MKKWLCKVCGYIYEGPEAPAECPVCHAKSNMFDEVKGELSGIALDIAQQVIEREVKEKDHEAFINEFIENVGEAS